MELSLDRQCRRCGKEFFAYRANQQYCSSGCREKEWHKEERESRVKEKHVCKRCHNEFETNDKRKLFCTKECRFEYFNSLRPTTKAIQRECPECHKKFVPMQKRGVGKLYCSSKCQHRFNYKKNHSNIKERQASWHKKHKWNGNWEAALTRDKYTCVLCGKTLYPSQWYANSQLEVHHRDGSGERESKNHILNNLMTLCSYCHREFHTKINLVQVDGKYFVRGKIFDILGLKNIDTCA